MSEEKSALMTCPQCGHRNRPGIIFCEQCGTQLVRTSHKPAADKSLSLSPELEEQFRYMDQEATETVNINNTTNIAGMTEGFRPGTPVFERNMLLRLEIKGTAKPLLLNLEDDKPKILGRKDPEDQHQPDVDLMLYGGYKAGVSRRHAALIRKGRRLHIIDLGSSNGTYINETRLEPEERHQLRDNDHIRLGTMTFSIGFQPMAD